MMNQRKQKGTLGVMLAALSVNVVVEISDGAVVIRPLPDGGWRGVGRELADGTDATDYVKKPRDEWESGG